MIQKSLKHYVSLNNKKYPYSLRLVDDTVSWVECEAACIAQVFLHEDIPALLTDLPYLIQSTKEHTKNQENVVRFRVSNEDKQLKKVTKASPATFATLLFVIDLQLLSRLVTLAPCLALKIA